eukprot:8398-Heterococcus_DN1.PRE.1
MLLMVVMLEPLHLVHAASCSIAARLNQDLRPAFRSPFSEESSNSTTAAHSGDSAPGQESA